MLSRTTTIYVTGIAILDMLLRGNTFLTLDGFRKLEIT
jgi:hypothetical protein